VVEVLFQNPAQFPSYSKKEIVFISQQLSLKTGELPPKTSSKVEELMLPHQLLFTFCPQTL
jgi:hypothetical protein